MIVKDSMVLIHLAKITLLEKSCDHFKQVLIPLEVHNEIQKGIGKGYGDVEIIEDLIRKNKINIKEVKSKETMAKLNEYNIQKGEAEAIALYLQENAQFLATDDDNVRRKNKILNLNIIGTPTIILKLRKDNKIDKEKFIESLEKLKEIGWFNSSIIDKMKMEEEKWTNQ